MKDNNDNIKKIVITVGIVLLLIIFYLILKSLSTNNGDDEEYLKNYKVNEYISTYVSDEDMARIYLNDYVNNMYLNTENAYNLLDIEYRDKRFGNIDNYKNYVSSLNYTTFTLDRYYKKESNGYIIFGVYDKNGNFFAFKTKGVMQYTVFLDESTVEIR